MIREMMHKRNNRLLFGLFFLSLVFFLMAKSIPLRDAKALREEMTAASRIMSRATAAIRECREEKNLVIDSTSDVNGTGLIGVKSSPITTSLGSLEAKRTSTNPNFAGLIVSLLRKAGVGSGDTIAVGASSYFPAFILATLSAARAMDLEPLVLVSLGASQWGANHPDFHWLHIQKCLQQKGIFSYRPIAFSMGGDRDTGGDMQGEGRSLLANVLQESGFRTISEGDLEENVASKMEVYFQEASGAKIKAFVNIGGSWSNLGIDSAILHLRPGLAKISRFPPKERRGVLYAMAALDIPVIHLLYVRGLARRYGLPWDPVPLPQPGQGEIYQRILENQKSFLYISIGYLVLFGVFLALGMKKST